MSNSKFKKEVKKKIERILLEVQKNPISILIFLISSTIFSIATFLDLEKIRFLALDFEFWPERWYSIVTYGFVHVDWNHVIVNMLLLYWMGIWVERLIGSKRFIVLVFTGILAGGLSILIRETAGIGFSAGAAALLFYYHFAFPFKKELPFKVPNFVLPVVLLILSIGAIIFGWLPAVGHYPHIAGALVGVIFLGIFRKHHKKI